VVDGLWGCDDKPAIPNANSLHRFAAPDRNTAFPAGGKKHGKNIAGFPRRRKDFSSVFGGCGEPPFLKKGKQIAVGKPAKGGLEE
jgi:hypothetical protein